jgi:quinoprotein glucose dehydrogenase
MNLAVAGLFFALFTVSSQTIAQQGEWPVYGHDPGGQRFSPLTTINRSNVSSLKVAWIFQTGDAYTPKKSRPTLFEATPLYVDGTVYIGTPLGRIIALDPVSGKQRWAFDGHVNRDLGVGDNANRGVSTWKASSGERRIYLGTVDARLIAVNAATGALCSDFGDNGVVDLRGGLRIPPRDLSDYEETSPPAIVGNTIVIGSGVADNGSVSQPSGEVRGFDTLSGKRKWTWDPIPQDSKAPGANTWERSSAAKTGAANAWSVIVADPERDLVFIPTGSPSPDYYGGERIGDNKYANSVVALRASTGEFVWGFQTVHHDLWDFDVASPPTLFDVKRSDRTVIPAVAVGSKTANLFLLNRETGQPIFGVEERPVPKSDVPGEIAAPSQPFPVKPAPVSPQRFSLDQAWGADEADRAWCRDELGRLRNEGIFTPPSVRGTLSVPGNIGGMAWGGTAYDKAHGLLILPTNNLIAEMRLIPRADYETMRDSRGRKIDGDWEFAAQSGTPYGMMRRFLLSPKHVPCTPPPWGTLLAIDANTGDKRWEVPLGHFPSLTGGEDLPAKFGSISLGGPIVTAAGLVFIAGTIDSGIYAFDAESGKQLWRAQLPTSARSTPMTYEGPDGKQYVLVAAGGHNIPGAGKLGDYLVAFSLPDASAASPTK